MFEGNMNFKSILVEFLLTNKILNVDEKFNYNQCGKNFAIGFNLKVQIQNVHVILLEKFFKVPIENVHKIFENTIVMSVAKISHKILN